MTKRVLLQKIQGGNHFDERLRAGILERFAIESGRDYPF